MLAGGQLRQPVRLHGQRRIGERQRVHDLVERQSRLVGSGANGATAPGPVDLDLSNGDDFLYVLSSSSGAITGFSVNASDGSLTANGGASGFAAGAAGLIAV